MVRAALILIVLTSALGCEGLKPAPTNLQHEFTYRFPAADRSQLEIWRSARNFFAGYYGDSRQVFRVADEAEGTLIGRALVAWPFPGGNCQSAYEIEFVATNGKANLRLNLLEGVPPLSDCAGYPWPTVDGYHHIVTSFDDLAAQLQAAIEHST